MSKAQLAAERGRILATCFNIYYGRSPSAHIVVAKMRRVERRFREMRRDAQLPEAACARRG
eukprot:2060659-Pleurochrysis_carterae.AAC.1